MSSIASRKHPDGCCRQESLIPLLVNGQGGGEVGFVLYPHEVMVMGSHPARVLNEGTKALHPGGPVPVVHLQQGGLSPDGPWGPGEELPAPDQCGSELSFQESLLWGNQNFSPGPVFNT